MIPLHQFSRSASTVREYNERQRRARCQLPRSMRRQRGEVRTTGRARLWPHRISPSLTTARTSVLPHRAAVRNFGMEPGSTTNYCGTSINSRRVLNADTCASPASPARATVIQIPPATGFTHCLPNSIGLFHNDGGACGKSVANAY